MSARTASRELTPAAPSLRLRAVRMNPVIAFGAAGYARRSLITDYLTVSAGVCQSAQFDFLNFSLFHNAGGGGAAAAIHLDEKQTIRYKYAEAEENGVLSGF